MKSSTRRGRFGLSGAMIGFAATLALGAALANLVACAARADRPARVDDLEALFDGVTLTGWTQRGGDADYSVEDGAIVGETRPNTPNTFLCTDQTFSDFRLELEFLVDAELNSGVQIRSHARPEGGRERVYGYQGEIDPTPRAFTAGVYEEGGRGWLQDLKSNPAAQAAFRPGAWNTMVIECRSESLRTWLNGVAAANLHDSVAAEGFIALQVHDVGKREEPLRVRWRKIVIVRL